MSSLTEISEMNVHNTEQWIGNLRWSKGWSEVDTWADSFRRNLKSDIKKYCQRLEMMAAINDLYSIAAREGENGIIKESLSSTSPSTDRLNELLTNEGRGYIQLASNVNYPNQTAPSLWTAKSAGSDVKNYAFTVPPGCRNWFGLSKDAQEVKKWFEPRNKSFLARKSNKSLAYNCPKKSEHPTDHVKCHHKRAIPGKQIAYKALYNVTIQKGKKYSSPIVGELIKNSIVLINQIKGRRGRIVLRKPNGELLVVGWVPLRTSKGHQLLAKYKKKGGAEVQTLDAVIEWKTKSPLEDFKTTQ